MLKVVSLNLNGIRSAVRKGFLPWAQAQQADFICVQELKAQTDDITAEMAGWADRAGQCRGYFHSAQKKGYSGVGIYTAHAPRTVRQGLGIDQIDAEGRYLELAYDGLTVISVYLPSGSSGEHRQAAKYHFMDVFIEHLVGLRQRGGQVLICGDWNIAHQQIDLKNWKGNQKNSGFLPEERAWMSQVLDSGWVDVYRHLHPQESEAAYTWWSNRGQAWAKNVGWRIDYHIATPQLAHSARRASVYKEGRFSDHAPLSIDYEWAWP